MGISLENFMNMVRAVPKPEVQEDIYSQTSPRQFRILAPVTPLNNGDCNFFNDGNDSTNGGVGSNILPTTINMAAYYDVLQSGGYEDLRRKRTQVLLPGDIILVHPKNFGKKCYLYEY